MAQVTKPFLIEGKGKFILRNLYTKAVYDDMGPVSI